MAKSAKKWISGLMFLVILMMSESVQAQLCPDPSNMIMGANEVCPGSQEVYSVAPDPSGIASYVWVLDGGGQILGATDGTQVTVEWQDLNSGPFTLRCTIQVQSCILMLDYEVNIADDYERYPFNCFGEVNIPLDNNCEKLIMPQHLLTSGVPDCPGTYEVSLSINGEIPVPNPVTIEYANQIITATITHPPTGRSCESLVLLTDANPPELICENDTTICNDVLAWDPFTPLDTTTMTGFKVPEVIDNCDEGLVPEPQGYEWIQLFNDPVFSGFIVRNWRAIDKYGNEGTCVDTLFMRRVIFDSIVCPPDTVILCDSIYFDPMDPRTSGVPTFDGYPIYTDKSFCEVGIEYEDKVAYHCSGTYTIYREWILSDLDAQSVTYDTCHQIIEVIDTTGPDLMFNDTIVKLVQHPDLFGVNPDSFYKTVYYPTLDYTCMAHGYFPTPVITDNCSNVDSVVVDILWDNGHLNYLHGTPEADHLKFDNLEKGKHIITITARDGCHNLTVDTLIAVAKDIKAPFIITDRYPVVTLADLSEVTWVDVDVFDEGTWDNCGYESLWARRVDWDHACGVDLCDSIVPYCTDKHGDSLYCAVLDQDKHLNAVESHYAEGLRWLCEDEDENSKILLGGWWYDLIRLATLECADLHYDLDEHKLIQLLSDSSLQCTDEFAALEGLCNKLGFDFFSEVMEFTGSYIDENPHNGFDIIRQIGGGWSKEIPFCCEDACEGGKVTIEILAIDHSGNVSKQWVDVEVEDKSAPEVKVQLPDLDISCYAYNTYYRDSIEKGHWDVFGSYEKFQVSPYNHEYGKFVIKDRLCTDKPGGYGDYHEYTSDTLDNGLVIENCNLVVEEYQDIHFESCGVGWIERHFTFSSGCKSEKAETAKAVQRINIYNDCELRESDIIWPYQDTTIYGCDDANLVSEGPVVKYIDECRQIGISHKDLVTSEIINADSICKKIIRTWAVIDWCRQNAEYHDDWIDDQQFHYYEFEQVIYLKDTLGPTINGCELDTICIGSDCSADLDITIGLMDNCSDPDEMEVNWTLYEKNDYGYSIIESGNNRNAFVPDLAIGTYRMVWKARDGCNIESKCVDDFEVVDCVKPTPICLGSTSVKLYPVDINLDGQIDTAVGEVWANELNVSSYDNCPANQLEFRLRKKGTGIVDMNGTLLPPDSSAHKLSLGCQDIGRLDVELWVLDAYGNADYCEVIIDVQQPVGGCEGNQGVVRGQVTSIGGGAVSHVEMVLTDNNSGRWLMTTDKFGEYRFNHILQPGKEYQLTADKVDDPLDGISTLDMILLAKHILGKQRLEEVMERTAADANQDGRISIGDVVQLRKLILGKIDFLPGNNMWSFLNMNMDRTSRFDVEMDYRQLLDFTGIKFGDITGNAGSPDSYGRSRNPESNELILSFEDIQFKAGQELIVPLKVRDALELQGFQMALKYNPSLIESISLSESVLQETYYSQQQNGIRILGDGSQGPNFVEDNHSVVVLTIRTNGEGLLSDAMALDNSQIGGEIYDMNDSVYDLRMISTRQVHTGMKMGQNFPNPFSDHTTIRVDLPEACEGKLNIYHLTGSMVYSQHLQLPSGTSELVLERSDFDLPGVYIYELKTPFGTNNRRMIFTR